MMILFVPLVIAGIAAVVGLTCICVVLWRRRAGTKPTGRAVLAVVLLVAGVFLAVAAFVLGRQFLPGQAAAAYAPDVVAPADRGGQALLQRNTAIAVREYGAAAQAASAAGRKVEAEALADTAKLLDRMEAVPEGASLGILEAYGCEALYVQRAPGRTSVLYRHPAGILFMTATDVADDATGEPIVKPAGDGYFVGWARSMPGGTYYVHGVVSTRRAAAEIAGWHARPERLPSPQAFVIPSPPVRVPKLGVHVPPDGTPGQ